MQPTQPMNRRRFLQASAFAAAAAVTGAPLRSLAAASGATSGGAGDPWRGLKMGMASYTLRKFTLDQAIAMTKEAGLKYICLKDVHLPLKSTRAQRQEALKKVTDAGLTMMSGGVIAMKNDPAQVLNIFEYARDAGMATIVCSPDPDAMDLVEQHVKQFDIRIAIHNHGPTDKKYPAPQDALKLIAPRDKRMGLCIDVGHTARIGVDTVKAIHECADRLYDFHLKDVTEATVRGRAVVLGTGVIPLPAVLKALIDVKFAGLLGLEYEIDADNPMPGIQASLAYVKQALATMG